MTSDGQCFIVFRIARTRGATFDEMFDSRTGPVLIENVLDELQVTLCR